MSLQCPLCSVEADTEFKFISHLRKFHHLRNELSLMCPTNEEDCKEKMFKTVSGLVSHYYNKHYFRPSAIVLPSEESRATHQISEGTQRPFNDATVVDESDSDMNYDEVSTRRTVTEQLQFKVVKNQAGVCFVESSSRSETQQEEQSCWSDIEFDDIEVSSEENLVDVLRNEKEKYQLGIDTSNLINPMAEELVLYLRRKNAVPQNVVQEVIKLTKNLLAYQIDDFCTKVLSVLTAKNVNFDVKEVEDVKDKLPNPFLGLETKKQQDYTFSKRLNIVKPRRVFIGRTLHRKRVRSGKFKGRQTTAVENHVVFNSLIEFLEKLVSHPDYAKISDSSAMNPDPDILDSFIKSEKFKNSEFFQKHPNAIRLKLYFDEYDSCDSLASKAGKHKNGAFYVEVDNILPQYRSNLDTITMVATVNNNLLKDVGMNAVLVPVLEELKKLEDGMVLSNGVKLHASLIGVMGDNLGVHCLCGLKEGFTAKRTCHHCMADQEGIHTMVKENVSLLRSSEKYESQIRKMELAQTKKKREELKTEYGLNNDCSLNKLKTFHITSGIVADVMHDLLEGILPMQIKKLLNHLISGNVPIISLDWLNSMLADFDYEYSEASDKPSYIRTSHVNEKDGKLHQSSAQMWLLATYLPPILGFHVPEDDAHWINFLLLVEICRIVFSPSLPKFMVYYLDDLVEEYLINYRKLYGDLIPKQHFLIHYARLIISFGPLYLFSCMRMEAVHRWFKREAYTIGNYINLTVSLACKYSLRQAYDLSKPLIREITYGPTHQVVLKDSEIGALFTQGETVVKSSWLKLSSGIVFVPNRSLVAVDVDEGFEPQFAEVMYVLVQPQYLLVCRKYKTVKHDPHSGCYEVEGTSSVFVQEPKSILGHTVFHKHTINNRVIVVPKYTFMGCL